MVPVADTEVDEGDVLVLLGLLDVLDVIVLLALVVEGRQSDSVYVIVRVSSR